MEVTEDFDLDEVEEAKLFPRWQLRSDDQILVVGLVVFAILVVLVAWSTWRNAGSSDLAVASSGEQAPNRSDGDDLAGPATIASPTPGGTIGSAALGVEHVHTAIDRLPGNIAATVDGSTVRLTGYVADRGESDDAEVAVLAMTGVETVDNHLVLLAPAVADALDRYGVVGPSATGVGTDMTVRGTLAREGDRRGAIDAAFLIPGVTEVVDDLNVAVTGRLDDLPQVEFATGSARILATSFDQLDEAAALVVADGGRFEIQGYTDTVGDATANRALSAARAEAIRLHLIGAGVDPDHLTAAGYGETDRFAVGSSAEALAANRVVRFERIG